MEPPREKHGAQVGLKRAGDGSEPAKRARINIGQQLSLIEELAEAQKVKRTLTHADLAMKYGVTRSAVSKMIARYQEKGKEEREKLASHADVKTAHAPRFPIVEQAVIKVFLDARASFLPMTGESIQELARSFAAEAGLQEKFRASAGWLENFKRRYCIKSYRIAGESAAVDVQVVNSSKVELAELISAYEPENVFNIDETGLFYNAMPTTTLSTHGDVHGGKASKDRVTILLGANITGTEKLKPVLIAKSANPRCLKNIDREQLPVWYYSQKSSWMDGTIFSLVLKRLNLYFAANSRKVLLLMDNCSCHAVSVDLDLSCIKVHFLPPNTTSVLQPCDQGIIQSFKLKYKSRLLAKRILELQNFKKAEPFADCEPRSLNILEVISLTADAWNAVTASTINACWGKSGITPPAYIRRATDVPSRPSDWAELKTNVAEYFKLDSNAEQPTPLIIDEAASTFIDVDAAVVCRESPSREDIVAELRAYAARQSTNDPLAENPRAQKSESSSSDASEEESNTSSAVAAAAWARGLLVFMRKRPDLFTPGQVAVLQDVEGTIVKASSARRQTSITRFFTPQMAP